MTITAQVTTKALSAIRKLERPSNNDVFKRLLRVQKKLGRTHGCEKSGKAWADYQALVTELITDNPYETNI